MIVFRAGAVAIMLGAVIIEWNEGSIRPGGFLLGAALLIATFVHGSVRHSSVRDRLMTLSGLIVSTHILVAFSGQGDSALYSFYFIPIVFAAGSFGLVGATLSGLVTTGLYATFFLHATVAEVQAELIEETITLMFIALLSGYLVDRLQVEEQLRLAAERLEEERRRLAEIGLLAAQVAHEFRNPLQVIEGAAETIDSRGWVIDSGKPLLADLRNEARRMSVLASDFLTYGRPGKIDRRSVELRDVIERAGAGFAGARLSSEVPPGTEVHADPDALERVFRNLLTNAAQSGATEIILQCAIHKDQVHIRFRDNGKGVSDSIRKSLFEPFRTGRPGGVGLGLAIARRIVDEHGGAIELAESSGLGTVFEIRLPRGIQ